MIGTTLFVELHYVQLFCMIVFIISSNSSARLRRQATCEQLDDFLSSRINRLVGFLHLICFSQNLDAWCISIAAICIVVLCI